MLRHRHRNTTPQGHSPARTLRARFTGTLALDRTSHDGTPHVLAGFKSGGTEFAAYIPVAVLDGLIEGTSTRFVQTMAILSADGQQKGETVMTPKNWSRHTQTGHGEVLESRAVGADTFEAVIS